MTIKYYIGDRSTGVVVDGFPANVVEGHLHHVLDSQLSYVYYASSWNLVHPSVSDSISTSTGTVRLLNDATSPGNYKHYGSNNSGTKGWQDFASTAQAAGKLIWLGPTTSAQTVSSTTYATITGISPTLNNTTFVDDVDLWLRFPTSSTSGTFLIQTSHAFNAPTTNVVSAAAMGDQLTVAANDASTELTVTVASTGSANLMVPLKLSHMGVTAAVTIFQLQIKKGTISNNFEVYRARAEGRYA